MNVMGEAPEVKFVDVAGGNGALGVVPTGGAQKRVILLPGIHGRTSHILQVGQRLAAQGFEAVIADFYCTAAQRGELRSPADIGTASDALDHEAITNTVVELVESLPGSKPTAVLGYCVGGAIALLTAARCETVVAAAVYYGVLRSGVPAETRPDPIEAAGRITCPVLAHYGTTDVWCPMGDIDDLEAALAASSSPYQIYRYPGAGHAFEEMRSKGFRPVAAAEAATRTQTFLRHYLDV